MIRIKRSAMEKLKEDENLLGKIEKYIHSKNRVASLFDKIEERFGVSRERISSGFAIFIGLYLMFGPGKEFLCNLIGFAAPAYQSIKAIESKEKEDDTKWLIYWVVFSVFSLVESFSDCLFSWIPLYWFFKCVFLIYCMLPVKWNGSMMIYKKLILPSFLKHQEKIDHKVKQTTDKAAKEGKKLVAESLKSD